jgi:two-component system, NtrC family, nitrogen regulation sensor histidine kinase NtrY
LSSPLTTRDARPRRRTPAIVLLAIGIFVLFVVTLWQTSFNVDFLRPNNNEQILVFAALSALVVLLLIALLFVLFRTLLKLYLERRGGVLGSKFRTRMVWGALMLSFAPVIFLFLFAYGLMNRSIDKWFSTPVEEVRQDTAEMVSLISDYTAQNAKAEAISMAAAPDVQKSFATGNFSGVVNEFKRREATLQGGFAVALVDGHAEASFDAPDSWPVLKGNISSNKKDRSQPAQLNWKGLHYVLESAPMGPHGAIVVAMPLPEQFSNRVKEIEASQQRYIALAQERKVVRRTYLGMLFLLTVLVLFASTWFALFLSKLVTRPVAALAEATQEISRGNLDYRVHVAAADELGELVHSFNKMAEELESSRRQIEASTGELADANIQLERRRQHMETILESIPTGVVSTDANHRITRANRAMLRMFRPKEDHPGANPLVGYEIRDLFPPEVVEDIEKLLRRADRLGITTSPMEISFSRTKLSVAVTAALLQHENERLGYVLVFEDLSDLLRAEKQAAWREVARRVAHEIKNPLTPIALSAERIRRHLERGAAPDPVSLSVIRGCSETISGAVETVRSLVDEFSTLARFPAANPKPANINSIVEHTLTMFNGRLDHINVQRLLDPALPWVMADAEALKRAFANILDNAAEAMQDALVREIAISTSLLPSRDAVEVVIADTGPGVNQELKEKLFLPYFSTKKRGTGLGLAIVSRIIEDHRGSIRVEENSPVGTRFIVELPVAPATTSAAHA